MDQTSAPNFTTIAPKNLHTPPTFPVAPRLTFDPQILSKHLKTFDFFLSPKIADLEH